MPDHKIDKAILSVTDASWAKVAFVIAKVADTMGSDRPESDAVYDLIAERIEILVGDGRLLAHGDIKNWRHSEIRRPD